MPAQRRWDLQRLQVQARLERHAGARADAHHVRDQLFVGRGLRRYGSLVSLLSRRHISSHSLLWTCSCANRAVFQERCPLRIVDPITYAMPLEKIDEGFDLMLEGESIRSVVVYRCRSEMLPISRVAPALERING